eukprot:33840-Eustigmatos_ZCMA.PRE.1
MYRVSGSVDRTGIRSSPLESPAPITVFLFLSVLFFASTSLVYITYTPQRSRMEDPGDHTV